jgi:hypothetical protein
MMVGGERVPELVQEEVHAIRSFLALIAMLGHTLLAVETSNALARTLSG